MFKKTILASIAASSAIVAANAAPIVLDETFGPEIIRPAGAAGTNIFYIVSDLALPANGEDGYILEGDTFVVDGATLTLAPGTVLRGQPEGATTATERPGSLIVARDAQIIASGTAGAPIVFTTAAVFQTADAGSPGFSAAGDGSDIDPQASVGFGRTGEVETFVDATPLTSPLPLESGFLVGGEFKPYAGMWGGVGINGKSTSNVGGGPDPDVSIPGVIFVGEDIIEGFTPVPATATFETPGGTPGEELLVYGGVEVFDDSGVLEFVSIRHTGNTISPTNEIQGLTAGGLGAGTTINNLEIYLSTDDGIEVFGGTANFRNILIVWQQDDGFDIDQGYNGLGQFVSVILSDNTTDIDNSVWGDHGFEIDGDDEGSDGGDNLVSDQLPVTLPTFANVSVFGQTDSFVDLDELVLLRRRGGAVFYNSIFAVHNDEPLTVQFEAGGEALPPIGFTQPFGLELESDARFGNGLSGYFGCLFTAVDGGASTFAALVNGSGTGVDTTDAVAQIGDPANSNTVVAANAFAIDPNGTSGTAGPDAVFLSIPSAVSGAVPLAVELPTSTSVAGGAFFEATSFIGVAPPVDGTEYYTTGWTALNVSGVLADSVADLFDPTND